VTDQAWQLHRVVVGVDGSDSSIEALRWAGHICAGTGAEINAVTCWLYPSTAGMSGIAVAACPPEWDPAADAAQGLTIAVKAAFGDGPPPGLTTLVREGHPAQVLVELSHNADLLVIGTRGHGGFAGLLLGSVSAHCTEHAACPVTVTRVAPTPDEA
jgi:nucleotide-binding universal stress UspA family protein